jgi:hypothetical protein
VGVTVGVAVGVDVTGACEGKAEGAPVIIDGVIEGENVTGAAVAFLSFF